MSERSGQSSTAFEPIPEGQEYKSYVDASTAPPEMTTKAVLIAGNFMHLRQERSGLVLTVIVGLFVMALVLFALIAPDAMRISEMARDR